MSQHQNKQVKLQELEPPLPKASLFIWIICIGLLVLLVWAWLFKLEEVSTGTGKVVPSSKEQIIQSLEGGIHALHPMLESQSLCCWLQKRQQRACALK